MVLVGVSPLSLSAPSLPSPSSLALLPLRSMRLIYTANSSPKKTGLFAANDNIRTSGAIEDAAGEDEAVEEEAIVAAAETRLYSESM